MASLSLAPSSPLVADDEAGAMKHRGGAGGGESFILYSESWLRIEYLCAYYASGRAMTPELRRLMDDLKQLSGLFGDSRLLAEEIRRDSAFFGRPSPPPQIFSHVIWFSWQNAQVADSFSHTFASLAERLSPAAVPDAARRAALLVDILTGPAGIQSQARNMSDKSQALLKKILSFDQEVDKRRDWLQNLRNVNEKEIRALEEELRSVEQRLAAARGGGSLARGGGGGPSPEERRRQEREELNRLHDKYSSRLREARETMEILDRFRPDVAQLCRGMEEVDGVWLNVDMTISRIVSDYGPEKLGDLNWVMQTMDILEAQKRWADIGRTARRFTEAAQVPLPEKASFQNFLALASAA